LLISGTDIQLINNNRFSIDWYPNRINKTWKADMQPGYLNWNFFSNIRFGKINMTKCSYPEDITKDDIRPTLVEPKRLFWDPYVLDRGCIEFRHHLRGYIFNSDFTFYLTHVLAIVRGAWETKICVVLRTNINYKNLPWHFTLWFSGWCISEPTLMQTGWILFSKNLGNWSVIGALLRPANWK
jgi:hypothetical protein